MILEKCQRGLISDSASRHWPIGLIYDNHTISSSIRPSASSSSPVSGGPLRLLLHLVSPPTDKLLLSPSAEACKQAFMGQMKEADFIRWGGTKKMTGLRKTEQDGLWEGIKERESSSTNLNIFPISDMVVSQIISTSTGVLHPRSRQPQLLHALSHRHQSLHRPPCTLGPRLRTPTSLLIEMVHIMSEASLSGFTFQTVQCFKIWCPLSLKTVCSFREAHCDVFIDLISNNRNCAYAWVLPF